MDSVGAGTFGKPLLVELSHVIEQFVLAVAPGVPTVVIAMFQRLAYFSREAQVYREIAVRGAVTVVGMVEDAPPQLPPGVRHVLVPAADDLEREWSLTALTPGGGATLVASDLETIDPDAPTLERGRSGCGRSWGWTPTPRRASTSCSTPSPGRRSRDRRRPGPLAAVPDRADGRRDPHPCGRGGPAVRARGRARP